jgi:hypothetical protein
VETWEYKTQEYPAHALQSGLNTLAEMGWECVCVVAAAWYGGGDAFKVTQYVAIFKRRKQQ